MRRFHVLSACLTGLLMILVPGLPPVHAQSADYGGYRPQYPPIGAYNTVGGRGGDIYFVDTLVWDTGAATRCTGTCGGLATTAVCSTVTCYRGSLKACLAAQGARFCLPTVSGYIDMPFTQGIVYIAYNDNLTIAAQTAPSPGLSLRYDGISFAASNVVVQHLRLRNGYPPAPYNKPCGSGITTYNRWPWGAVPDKIVFDHVSAAWAKDDNMGVGDGATGDIMVWRSNVSEPLNYHTEAQMYQPCSGGEGGYPGHCLPIGQSPSGKVIFVGESVLSNCPERMPITNGTVRLAFINNIIHGFHTLETFQIGNLINDHAEGPFAVSAVGNRYVANSVSCASPSYKFSVANWMPGNALYRRDNTLATIPGCANVPTEMHIYPAGGGCTPNPCLTYDPTVGSPPAAAPLPTAGGWAPRASNAAMETFVLANVGARPLNRDSVDTRIVNDVATRTYRSVHHPNDVGGFPTLANNTRSLAIPSNPHAIAPGQTFRTNIEVWLETLARDLEGGASGLSAPKTVSVVR